MNASKDHSLIRDNRLSHMRYSILVFLFFTARLFLLSSGRTSFSTWITTPYVITYKSGFIARAFIGSVVAVFTDYLTIKSFKILLACAALVMLALISFLLGKVIAAADPDYKKTVLVFVLLFLSAPVSMTYLFETHFGRLETFMLIYTLTGLIALKKPGFEWVVPVLCFFALATHPGYMVTYMPGLAVPMLYEVYRNKYSKKSIAVFTSSSLIMTGFFIYFQIFSRNTLGYTTAEEMGKALSQHTDMKIGTPMLYLEYFAPFPQWVTEYVVPITRSLALPVCIALLAVSSPLLIIFGLTWKRSISSADNKFLKFIFILCLAAPLVFVPAAVFGIDLDREWAPVINCQFIFLFYFVISKETHLMGAIKKTGTYFENHLLMFACILAFSATIMFSDFGVFWMKFFDKSLYDEFYSSALSNYDFMLG